MSDGAGPLDDEVEISLLGPGYGECVVVHLGGGEWLVVDSCLGEGGKPAAVSYLRGMGVDPAAAVKMVVATHWHDDHIGGMARLVTACPSARFCCATALCTDEFLAVAGGLADRDYSGFGSGQREIRAVFTRLRQADTRVVWATPNRMVLQSRARTNDVRKRSLYEVWSLSPGDALFDSFIRSVAGLVGERQDRHRSIRNAHRNALSVALWVRCGEVVCLLGADVEKPGWRAIINSSERPRQKASAFKIPHHGSPNADLPEIWDQLLEPKPVAFLAPWRLAGKVRPDGQDVSRILSWTPHAYASAQSATGSVKRRGVAAKTVRGTKMRIRRGVGPLGVVQLRRSLTDGGRWKVSLLGAACRLQDFAT